MRYSHYCIRTFLLLGIPALLLMFSCKEAGGNGSGSNGDSITASILPRSNITYNDGHRSDEYRTRFVAFSIEKTAGEKGDFRLAVRAQSEAAPDAEAMRSASASIVRTLSADPINLFMSFQMDSTIFDAGTAWNTSAQMPIESVDALLQPNTAYRLYAVSENILENTVYRLLDLKTDAEPSSTDVILHNMPPVEYTFTMRQNEPALYLFCSLNAGDAFFLLIDRSTVTQITDIRGIAIPYRLASPYNMYVTAGITNSILTTALISKRQFEGITIQNGKKIVITMDYGGGGYLTHDSTVIFQAVQ